MLFGVVHAQQSPPPKEKPLVLANYYVWYLSGDHETSPYAGWIHPDQQELLSDSKSYKKPHEPDIASQLYPLAGLYDSHDVGIAQWHVHLAQASGIDGFLVSWWGEHNQAWEKSILAASEKNGFKIALFDERAQFHEDFEWYKNSLTKALGRFKDNKAYLRIDNEPVVYLYQIASEPSLTPEKFSELKAFVEGTHGPIYWIVDKLAHNHQGQGSSIKHIPDEWLNTPGIDCFGFYSTFSHLREYSYQDLAPKYAHLANQAHGAGKRILLPVHPGHDNSRFSEHPYVIPRRNGQTFKEYLKAAEDAKADIIMVTSWNEWPESTVIEPSLNWKNPYHYLEILADWKGISFKAPALPK